MNRALAGCGVALIALTLTLANFLAEKPAAIARKKDSIESWVSEVRTGADSVQCQFQEQDQQRAALNRLGNELEANEERARLLVGEYLGTALRLGQLLSCPADELSQLPEWQRLKEARAAFLTQVTQRMRAHHAHLRRAQSQEQRDEARAAVENLSALLKNHTGSLSLKLERLRRFYENAPSAASSK